MQRTQIYLPPGQHKHLKDVAHHEGTSVSEVIRRLIAENISDPHRQKHSKVQKPAYRNAGEWAQAQAAWAEKNSICGPADLAANLDTYLYGDKK
ncbi:MAG: CopG family transcriptional regulator [Candidatus Saccharimonadales bacterium]